MSPDLIKKPLYYDAAKRRLWIYGQRCHHGATGALLAATGAVVLASVKAPASVAMLAAGSVLMVHDWKDRSIWFERGWQTQP
jgi:hypothetical protein